MLRGRHAAGAVAVGAEPAVVALDDRVADRHAQPDARLVTAGLVGEERPKHVGARRLVDAPAVFRDAQFDPRPAALDHHVDAAGPVLDRFQGVGQQVDQQLDQFRLIAADDGRGFRRVARVGHAVEGGVDAAALVGGVAAFPQLRAEAAQVVGQFVDGGALSRAAGRDGGRAGLQGLGAAQRLV